MVERNEFGGQKNSQPDKLNLYSMGKLEFLLGVPRAAIRTLAANAGGNYEPFDQRKKPRPFQKAPLSAKVRKIDNPTKPLKTIQRAINRNLLSTLALPYYLCGGVKGRSVKDNLTMHLGASCLVKLDIRSFFPNIDDRKIYKIWSELLNCSPEISDLLTKLTTFERHLPQGSPTSTMLANLVLFTVDAPIREKCRTEGVTYSSWVDDLAFSGDNPREVIQTAVEALRTAGFAISHRKLKIMGPRDVKILNGSRLGRFPTVDFERLAWLRSGIHKLATGEVSRAEIEKYVESLEGKIAHVSQSSPQKGKRLSDSLSAAKDRWRVTVF
jgi:RNA-directed DNA polymerase